MHANKLFQCVSEAAGLRCLYNCTVSDLLEVGCHYSEICPHLNINMAKGWARALFLVLPGWGEMPGCLNCCCQRPDPLYLPVRAEGRNGGYWNVRMSELEPPLPACVPTGTSFAPVRVHLHSLSLRVCRVKAVSFPCKLCSYILTNANSAFIPKGQLVFLGNLQP